MDKDKIKEIIESLDLEITFSPHDWSSHRRLAWIYGVICGWNDEALEEFKTKFGWTDETIKRLKTYNDEIKKLFN